MNSFNYDHKAVEEKWQRKWKEDKTYQTEENPNKEKCYVLDMFPYPSGEGLHVGHPKGYIATDVFSRLKRMQGKSVLHPMGWDAFGLPAENYAIKNKVHPRVMVEKNIARYKEQLASIGFDYDWDREINTTDPKYYKWTQWIFLQLFKKGLAHESNEPINWCPSCLTGLANEDVEDGKCERCGTQVEKRPIRQWVLKIREYADKLLEGLNDLDWPKSIKESQRNWIGRSEGMLFTAPVKDTNITIDTFSAHFEACYADTFVVIAPDHGLLPDLLEGIDNKEEILETAKHLAHKQNEKDFDGSKNVEGVFTGRYIVDPLGNGDLPIWIASYALADYGTGIVKCSCHDERDFAFAKKYDIPLKPVLFPKDEVEAGKVRDLEECFVDMKNGVLTEPEEVAGQSGGSVREIVIKHLEEKGLAKKTVNYKLRDWVFSRQRYWGEPIPIIHCEKCGPVAVPESDLPVVLPDVEHYEPTGTGESPLANIPEWVNVACPECGGEGKRETNTMPQWAGSSWYYLRYMDNKNDTALVDPEKEKYWQPVDMYVGGAEHATRHLIYARFWHKFLHDIGVVSESEPFKRLQHVGLIQAEDGRKMSKRFGNVVNPDDIVNTYGADTLRVYEMFMGPFDQNIEWSTKSIIGPRRFLERVGVLSERVSEDSEIDKNVERELHKAIQKVSEDIISFRFNTAISTLMTLGNTLHKLQSIPVDVYKIFLQLLAPFAPHITEELWSMFVKETSIHNSIWPVCNTEKIIDETVTIAVQVNGKVRDTFEIDSGKDEDEVKTEAQELPGVSKWIEGKNIKKIIYIKDKLISIVVDD
ncbi:leucine--tRNA ligase [Candidatus Wolfebacteria bacterium]|nr:MAG: leucine--tRNA ligase [Candidatus Wolfebacteria bacterium]